MRKGRIALYLIFTFSISAGLPPPGRAFRARETPKARQRITTIKSAPLRQTVTIRRDDRGIPYIEAANESDLFLAQGYVTASDRLWQMDLLRRTARGELSELFGSATLEEDKRHRIYGFASVVEGQVSNLHPRVRSLYEEYARGVNAFIESLEAESLPVEFRLLQYRPRPWTPADSLIIGKLLAESLSSTWTADLVNEAFSDLPKSTRQELRPQVSPWDVLAAGSDRVRRDDARRPSARGYWRDQAISTGFLDSLSSIDEAARRSLERAGLYAVERAASNNWVVSGEHSVSGKAMLANDPHLEPSAPSIWYMSHLTAPAFHVAGVTLPGVPCILLGHNDRIAWGATNLGSDVQDVYIVTFDKQNPRLYKTSRSWREASVRREYIKARKSLTDTATETIPFDVTVTRLGPIALERDSKRYAVRWTALDTHAFDVSAFYEINRAQNWKGFCAALSAYSGPAQNFVYADKEGHIGYYGAGKIPVRRSGDGTLPYDGSTDAGEWVGFIPFDKLPHSYDPPSGIIITANNRVVGRNYPYILTQSWAPPYRVRRILDLLQSKPRLSVDDFRAVQRDIYSISAAHFARNVVEIARKFDPAANDAKWNETVALLEQWDGRLGADSRAAPLLSYMRAAFRTRVAGRVLGDDRAKKYGSWVGSVFLDRIIADRPKEWLPAGFNNYLELLKVCEKEAREELAKRLGSDESKWVWGRLAEVRFAHPLAAAPLLGQRFVIQAFPQNGSTGAFPTVNAGSNVSMRFIADVSDWDKTEMGIALGESGDPASPHWDDQFADWRAAKARVFTFTKRGVAGATRETVILAAGN